MVTCPEASETSNRHFRNFASIKNHLNDHCTGHLTGAIPLDFLHLHSYSQCRICDRVLHTRYHGICPRCGPTARAQAEMIALRNRADSPGRNAALSQWVCSTFLTPVLYVQNASILTNLHKTRDITNFWYADKKILN